MFLGSGEYQIVLLTSLGVSCLEVCLTRAPGTTDLRVVPRPSQTKLDPSRASWAGIQDRAC